jgi:hypothetical protein
MWPRHVNSHAWQAVGHAADLQKAEEKRKVEEEALAG